MKAHGLQTSEAWPEGNGRCQLQKPPSDGRVTQLLRTRRSYDQRGSLSLLPQTAWCGHSSDCSSAGVGRQSCEPRQCLSHSGPHQHLLGTVVRTKGRGPPPPGARGFAFTGSPGDSVHNMPELDFGIKKFKRGAVFKIHCSRAKKV